MCDSTCNVYWKKRRLLQLEESSTLSDIRESFIAYIKLLSCVLQARKYGLKSQIDLGSNGFPSAASYLILDKYLSFLQSSVFYYWKMEALKLIALWGEKLLNF